MHWVSAAHAVAAEVRLYDRLFSVEDPEGAPEGKTFLDYLNPHSLEVLSGAQAEQALVALKEAEGRNGAFCSGLQSSAVAAYLAGR